MIRSIEDDDVPAIVACYEASITTDYVSFSEIAESKSDGPGHLSSSASILFRDQLKQQLNYVELAPARNLCIASWDGEELLGFSLAHIESSDSSVQRDVCWLNDLVVAEKHRHKGVARKLIAAVEGWAVMHGANYIFLESGKDNHAMHKLADGLCYEPVATVFVRNL